MTNHPRSPRAKFKVGEWLWNKRWRRHGRFVKVEAQTLCEGKLMLVHTGKGVHDGFEKWVEKDCRPLLVKVKAKKETDR